MEERKLILTNNMIYIKILKQKSSIKFFTITRYKKYNYIYIFLKSYFIKCKFNSDLVVVIADLKRIRLAGKDYALFKTYDMFFNKLFEGIGEKYVENLTVFGLGFKYRLLNNMLYLILGYSHVVSLQVPDNILIKITKKNIYLESYDKFLLNGFIFKLKSLRPLDIYKAKGVRLRSEVIITKKGKQVAY